MIASDLAAIDVHTHAMVSAHALPDGAGSETGQAAARYFGSGAAFPTLDEIAAHYRERKMACVVFPVDTELSDGNPPVPNEEVAEAASRHPDVLIPFASIDPHRGWTSATTCAR
jgi:predicted TIM-barrel fold metal-dependent hydrolase